MWDRFICSTTCPARHGHLNVFRDPLPTSARHGASAGAEAICSAAVTPQVQPKRESTFCLQLWLQVRKPEPADEMALYKEGLQQYNSPAEEASSIHPACFLPSFFLDCTFFSLGVGAELSRRDKLYALRKLGKEELVMCGITITNIAATLLTHTVPS